VTYRILVTGSRTWTDFEQVRDALHRAFLEGCMTSPYQDHPVLIHGDAPMGADKIAEDVWLSNVGPSSIERHPAAWGLLGKRAGFIRNQYMVDSKPDVVLAFLDWCRKPEHAFQAPHRSHGADDCVRRARVAGIEVREFYP
jgi:hypothetical protein